MLSSKIKLTFSPSWTSCSTSNTKMQWPWSTFPKTGSSWRTRRGTKSLPCRVLTGNWHRRGPSHVKQKRFSGMRGCRQRRNSRRLCISSNWGVTAVDLTWTPLTNQKLRGRNKNGALKQAAATPTIPRHGGAHPQQSVTVELIAVLACMEPSDYQAVLETFPFINNCAERAMKLAKNKFHHQARRTKTVPPWDSPQ